VWVSTGNGPNGDSVSIVRLDGSTLARQDAWMAPVRDVDLDFGASPTLFSANLNGAAVQMVGACNKNGVFYALRSYHLAAGPEWSYLVGSPPSTDGTICLAAAVSDGTHLFVAGNTTTIQATSYPGSVRELDPATGAVVWARGLPDGPIYGTPSLDGAGVLAAASYNTASGATNSVSLLDASSGTVLARYTLPAATFAQPVFADGYLLLASSKGGLTAYGP